MKETRRSRITTKADDFCWHYCPSCKRDWKHIVLLGRGTYSCRLIKVCKKCRQLQGEKGKELLRATA